MGWWVLSLARASPARICLLTQDGGVVEWIRIPHRRRRLRSNRSSETTTPLRCAAQISHAPPTAGDQVMPLESTTLGNAAWINQLCGASPSSHPRCSSCRCRLRAARQRLVSSPSPRRCFAPPHALPPPLRITPPLLDYSSHHTDATSQHGRRFSFSPSGVWGTQRVSSTRTGTGTGTGENHAPCAGIGTGNGGVFPLGGGDGQLEPGGGKPRCHPYYEVYPVLTLETWGGGVS